ncbi:MAG: hypothetical protein AAFV38_09590, partial [Pseudomonadota bacterium]
MQAHLHPFRRKGCWFFRQLGELDRMEPTLKVLDLYDPGAEPQIVTLPTQAEAIWAYPHDAAPTASGPIQLTTAGFLTPPTTWLFDFADDASQIQFTKLTEEPTTFSSEGMEVRLH